MNAIISGSDNTGAGDFTRAVLSLIFSAIFLAITALTFITIGILLVIRYIYLAILLIALPLAWLMWIFPKLNHYFAQWWGLFLRWTFFPAISIFFIYLALQSVNLTANGDVASIGPMSKFDAKATAASMKNDPVTGFIVQSGSVILLQTALDELLMAGLCLGGLYAANALSIKGADTALGAAKWVGGQAKGYAGRKANAGRRNVTDRVRSMGKEYNPDTKETTTALQRCGSRLQGVPVLNGVGASLAGQAAPAALHEERKEDIKKYTDENLKSLTNDGLTKRAASNTFINPTQSAAIAQELARRNLTEKIDPKDRANNDRIMDRYVAEAARMGNLEAITNNRPDLMPTREKPASEGGGMETQEEATARAIKSARGEIIQAKPDVFKAPSAVLALSSAQLGPLGSDTSQGAPERQKNITEAIRDLIDTLHLKQEIETVEKKPIFEKDKDGKVQPKLDPVTGHQMVSTITVKTGKFELDHEELKKAIAANPALKDLAKIKDFVKHMESSSNWGSVLN